MQLRKLGAAAGLTAISALGLSVPATAAVAAQPADTSQVSVVHGIPGQPVDVYVNGDRALSNFEPATVAGPLELPAGEYDVAITAPGESIDNALLTVNDAAVPGGANLSLVAHLNENGEPTLTPFANDTSQIAAGEARLTVRHTAAAPAVDVRAGGQPVFEGLTNPNEATADIPAGAVSADVVLAGTDTVVLGPADVNLAEGTSTIVYAIGSADDQTLAITSQAIEGLQSAPDGVPAGSGGLADEGTPGWLAAAAGAGALLMIGGFVVARRARVDVRS